MESMERKVPDYERISDSYDVRYQANPLEGIAKALVAVSRRIRARSILEVGCGTGRWLECLTGAGIVVVGLDASPGMLARAAAKSGEALLVAASANQLPFTGQLFDLIYCVKALHHFADPRAFIEDAVALLRSNGRLAVVGIDPRTIRYRYHYEYFDGTQESEIRRYPSFGQIVDWFLSAGLEQVEVFEVEKSIRHFTGEEVLRDPFLQKDADSTLALLPVETYEKGLRRIREAIAASAEPLHFRSEMTFCMITGIRGG